MPASYHLVLLPGLDGTGLLFEPFLKAFPHPEAVTVVPYPHDKFLDFAALAGYVNERLPNDVPVVLLAESFSGPVAVQLLNHPMVKGVIFCASFAKSPRPFLLPCLKYFPLRLLFRLPVPNILLRFFCLGFTCPASVVTLSQQVRAKTLPSVLAFRLRTIASVNFLSLLKTSKLPMLYLHGSKDILVPKRCALEITSIADASEIKTLNAPHFILQSAPAESAAEIQAFISKYLTHNEAF